MAVSHLPFSVAPHSYSTKNVICRYNICSGGAESSTTVFWLRTSKQRSPLVCQSVPPCLTKPSFPPDSQIMCSRVTDVLHKPPPPLCSPSSLCRLCSQKGDEQLRRTAGRSLGGPDLPPCLPASTFLWILLCVLSDAEAGAGMRLSKPRVGMPGVHIALQK